MKPFLAMLGLAMLGLALLAPAGHAAIAPQHQVGALGTLPGDTGGTAYGIDGTGLMVGASTNASGQSRAFAWFAGESVDLNGRLTPASAVDTAARERHQRVRLGRR